jgi:hypothetical protein
MAALEHGSDGMGRRIADQHTFLAARDLAEKKFVIRLSA